MTKQKNKFLTFLFSFIPGGGQMYMGFMKRGLSLMLICALSLAISVFLNIGELGFLVAVAWFYAFFDAINLMSLDAERFAQQPDTYLLIGDGINLAHLDGKFYRYLGYALIIIGAYALLGGILEQFYNIFYDSIHTRLMETIYSIKYYLPRFLGSVFIIIFGYRLVQNKKKSSEIAKEQTDEK